MSSRNKHRARASKIHIEDVSGYELLPDPAELRRWIESVLAAEPPCEISFRIVGEPESAALNARYRGREGPTNVLAFAGEDMQRQPAARLLGDVVICAPVVAREALEQGKAWQAHWAHIAIHGVLHLLGYDHDRDSDAQVMERREAHLLAGLGFPDPY